MNMLHRLEPEGFPAHIPEPCCVTGCCCQPCTDEVGAVRVQAVLPSVSVHRSPSGCLCTCPLSSCTSTHLAPCLVSSDQKAAVINARLPINFWAISISIAGFVLLPIWLMATTSSCILNSRGGSPISCLAISFI